MHKLTTLSRSGSRRPRRSRLSLLRPNPSDFLSRSKRSRPLSRLPRSRLFRSRVTGMSSAAIVGGGGGASSLESAAHRTRPNSHNTSQKANQALLDQGGENTAWHQRSHPGPLHQPDTALSLGGGGWARTKSRFSDRWFVPSTTSYLGGRRLDIQHIARRETYVT